MAVSRIFAFAIVLLISFCSVQCNDYKQPHCEDNRDGIVHLFEWKWLDIAKECKDFLGPYGYCAVQVSPPNENRVIDKRPWYERYQPVSYKLNSTRSGNEEEFRYMCETCRKSGVGIYADIVMNHMTGAFGSGLGTGGSSYDAGTRMFPGVPWGPNDFNPRSKCPSFDGGVHNYDNADEVRNCNLDSLLDLKLEADYVRTKIGDYLNHLVDLGVIGFRLDAAKHMWPGDINAILVKVKNLPGGARPFVYQEVIDYGGGAIHANEYLANGRVTNFKYGKELSVVFSKKNALKWLSNWGEGWGMLNTIDVVNFIDNHDTQRTGGVLTHNANKPYKLAVAFMLAHPYGMPRVMSSYFFQDHNEGPPHNPDMSTKSVRMNGFVCLDGWVCEHRWRQIYNMVAFRNMASGKGVDNWHSAWDYQVAFSRGDRAFIAFNYENKDWDITLQTGLPGGIYCDVISGNLVNDTCTGKSVTVGNDGKADLQVCSNCDDPMVAIHVGAKIGSPERRH